MKQVKKWTYYFKIIALTVFIGYGVSRLYFRLTDDFRIKNIIYEMPHHSEWEIEHSTADLNFVRTLLDQPFHYIGKGAQSYAFASADNRYVLKFFKFKHRHQKWTIRLLPDSGALGEYKRKNKAKKIRKLLMPFIGYKLAYDVHKEGSGLVTIHLNPTTGLYQSVTVTDKIGLKREIPLDDYVFVVQEKAEVIQNRILNLLKQGNIRKVKELFNNIVDHHIEEYQRGLFDNDNSVMKNMGFVGDRPVRIDVGMLRYDETIKIKDEQKKDLLDIVRYLHDWFDIHYPSYRDEIVESVSAKILSIYPR